MVRSSSAGLAGAGRFRFLAASLQSLYAPHRLTMPLSNAACDRVRNSIAPSSKSSCLRAFRRSGSISEGQW